MQKIIVLFTFLIFSNCLKPNLVEFHGKHSELLREFVEQPRADEMPIPDGHMDEQAFRARIVQARTEGNHDAADATAQIMGNIARFNQRAREEPMTLDDIRGFIRTTMGLVRRLENRG